MCDVMKIMLQTVKNAQKGQIINNFTTPWYFYGRI